MMVTTAFSFGLRAESWSVLAGSTPNATSNLHPRVARHPDVHDLLPGLRRAARRHGTDCLAACLRPTKAGLPLYAMFVEGGGAADGGLFGLIRTRGAPAIRKWMPPVVAQCHS